MGILNIPKEYFAHRESSETGTLFFGVALSFFCQSGLKFLNSRWLKPSKLVRLTEESYGGMMSISLSQKSNLKSQNSQAIQTIQNPKSEITKSSHDCATPIFWLILTEVWE